MTNIDGIPMIGIQKMLINSTHKLLQNDTKDELGTEADGQECGMKIGWGGQLDGEGWMEQCGPEDPEPPTAVVFRKS
jgi:hypothetical protein